MYFSELRTYYTECKTYITFLHRVEVDVDYQLYVDVARPPFFWNAQLLSEVHFAHFTQVDHFVAHNNLLGEQVLEDLTCEHPNSWVIFKSSRPNFWVIRPVHF